MDRPTSRRPVLAATVATALVGVSGLVAAGPAWASYSGTVANTGSTYASASYYRCSSVVLPQSPYLYYKLAETSGTMAADSSGNNRNGTITGGFSNAAGNACATDSTNGMTLAASTGYIATPTQLTAPNVFTLQAWFKTTTTRGGRIIGFGNARTGVSSGNADRLVYMSDAGLVHFGVQTGNNQRAAINSADAYNDGNWHLVAASLSSTGMRLYVDGSLVDSRSTSSGISYAGYWRVGYDAVPTNWPSSPTSDYFAGALKQVAVYPTGLGAQAVADLYATGRP